MLRAYRSRIYPADVQQQTLLLQLGLVRWVYNHFLALQQERYENKKKHLSFFDMGRILVELKASDQYSWLYYTIAQSLLQGLKNLDFAYQNFFLKWSGYPNFKSRRNGHQSMAYPQHAFLDRNKIHIPKLDRVRMRKGRQIWHLELYCIAPQYQADLGETSGLDR